MFSSWHFTSGKPLLRLRPPLVFIAWALGRLWMHAQGLAEMDPESTVVQLIDRLKQGDAAAPEALWNRYYAQLARIARSRIKPRLRRIVDEEDIALSVFDTFCRGVCNGKFPELDGQKSLWPLLLVLTFRKVTKHTAKQSSKKRGAGNVVGHADLQANDSEVDLIAEHIGKEPTPDFIVEMEEQCEHLIKMLDRDLQAVARGKLAGLSNAELCGELGCGLRTIERRLGLIRRCWQASENGE